MKSSCIKSRQTVVRLRRCWPFCFIPLLMNRDKSVRALCPRCGHDYGTRLPADKLPKCTLGFSDFPFSWSRHLQDTECCGLRTQLDYQDRQ
ncbi:hypothetical protein X777_04267, partial [Ooceraea biroi]